MKVTSLLLALSCAFTFAADDPAAPPAITNRKSAIADGVDDVMIPQMLSYQGKLTDTLGLPVADTLYAIRFRLYAQPTGGTQLWEESQNVRTMRGLFSVLLGSVTPVGSVPDAGALYLSMAVEGGSELAPRLRIASAAYAYLAARAANSDLLQGKDTTALDARYVNEAQANSVSSAMITDGTIAVADLGQMGAGTGQVMKWTGSAWQPRNDSVGSGGGGGTVTSVSQGAGVTCTPNPITTTGTVALNTGYADGRYVNMTGDSMSGALRIGAQLRTYDKAALGYSCYNNGSAAFCAGYGNSASGDRASITGGEDNSAGGRYSHVSGGSENQGSGLWATVSGGNVNEATDTATTVSGGQENSAGAKFATVGGGRGNDASGYAATVAGGHSNAAEMTFATVGGGRDNDASGGCATVGGGYGNDASGDYVTVGGGAGNDATGYSATVGGGTTNDASGECATVGGGYTNDAPDSYATVGGGYTNHAGYAATVGGGYGNGATGNYSCVAGGNRDTASASYSFAVNHNSDALHSNSAAFNGQATTASNQTRVGVLSKASGTFTIDHPLNPAGKILNHYFIEGPEMLNIYRGSVRLDASGRAEVNLPDYFEALNRDPMVQLTGVGTHEIHVAEDVVGNHFAIGGKPGAKVYWQVTGERKDVSAEATRRMMPVEQPKNGPLAGRMLDDDFLVGCMEQLVTQGRAQGIDFRTAGGRQRYEKMREMSEQR